MFYKQADVESREMNKILVAVNGAPHSEKTLASAAKMAQEKESELVILYACNQADPSENQLEFAEQQYGRKFKNLLMGKELPTFSVEDNDGISSIAEYEEAREKLCQLYGKKVLDHAATEARKQGAIKITTRLEHGEIAPTILNVATSETADTIVLGECRNSNLVQFFTGCTAKEVLKKAKCEAIIVH